MDTENFALYEDSLYVNILAKAKNRNKVCVMNYYEVERNKVVVLFSKGTHILEQFNKFVTRLLESGEIIKHQKEINVY
jgi:hypothetical protein